MLVLQIKPVLAALKRHKAGTLLIGLQIALTLAIVCNALFIIQQRLTHLSRTTGIVESDLLTVGSEWTSASGAAVEPLVHADLQTLRELPGVQDVGVSYGYPLRGGGWNSGVTIKPDAKQPVAVTWRFFADDHVLTVLGAKLIAGRNFRADEIRAMDSHNLAAPAQLIITKALAEKVYPNQSALGKPLYIGGATAPSTIIGIMDHLQGGSASSWSDAISDYVVLEPKLLTDKSNAYLIRTRPGQLGAVASIARDALFKTNRLRIIPNGEGEGRGVRSFAQVREQAYKSDRGMAIIMSAICAVLLIITAAGIVGLTSFWVGQRRRQIGVRRALGATRHDILGYFLTENFLISLGGVMAGIVLALGLSLWLVTHFETRRLPLPFVLIGVALLLLLGQVATFAPALRASRVSPAEATRSA
jgi:putative ABC transport system permease protein